MFLLIKIKIIMKNHMSLMNVKVMFSVVFLIILLQNVNVG